MHELQRGITSTGHNMSRGNQNFTNKIDMRYTPIDSRSGLSGNVRKMISAAWSISPRYICR